MEHSLELLLFGGILEQHRGVIVKALATVSCPVPLQLMYHLGNKEMVVRSKICSTLHTDILERPSKLPTYAYMVWFSVDRHHKLFVDPFVLYDAPYNSKVAQST